jgi:hypothetical protein
MFWNFQNIPQALGSIWVNFGKFPKTLVLGIYLDCSLNCLTLSKSYGLVLFIVGLVFMLMGN